MVELQPSVKTSLLGLQTSHHSSGKTILYSTILHATILQKTPENGRHLQALQRKDSLLGVKRLKNEMFKMCFCCFPLQLLRCWHLAQSRLNY